jgi:hypothetical protein
MTEEQWLTCTEPRSMLLCLGLKRGVRKLRLFTVACYRRKWHGLDDDTRRAVEAAEQLADDRERIAARGLRAAKADADAARYAAHSAVCSTHPESAAQADLLRDIFGPLPFGPLPPLDPAVRTWNDGTVPRIAQAIYEERAFDRLPLLADALEDAGCAEEAILRHCRQQEAAHVRGCWVVDAVLGKS